MPILNCPHCEAEQTVPRELAGLIFRCKQCGEEFKAVEPKQRIEQGGLAESFDFVAILKSIRLLVLLIVPVGLVLFAAFFILTSKQKAERERNTPKINQQKKDIADEKQWDEEEKEKTKDKIIAGFGYGIVLLILIGVAIYVFLLVTMGAWIAKDAFARGMNGLGWASFYYLFHFFSRVLIVGLSLVPAINILGFGMFVFPVAELVSWMGFFTYIYARRPGKLTLCKTCKNRQLFYLQLCPHCGD